MDFSNTRINKLSVHYIGNQSNDEELILSVQTLDTDALLAEKLCGFFLNKFPAVFEAYQFYHPSSLSYNEVYNFSLDILKKETPFHELSRSIARHLFSCSTHPKVNAGELYVCHFENCELNGKSTDAVGIFKTETKNGFFEVQNKQNSFEIQYKEGIDINKIDKACLILNSEKENGFLVYIIDNQNRGEEAKYWRDNFLGLKQISNEFHQTREFLSMTKSFVTKQLPEEFEVDKTDKIDLLNRSVEYFKSNETFDKSDFEQEVLQNEDLIDSFQKYDNSYRADRELNFSDGFDISAPAVRKQARVFKSVLKLDKNFHIYIHGNRELIEKGVDQNGRKFYKIYFEDEH
jgi:hypothetical protein